MQGLMALAKWRVRESKLKSEGMSDMYLFAGSVFTLGIRGCRPRFLTVIGQAF